MKDESEGNFLAEFFAALDRAEKLALAKKVNGLQSGTFTCGGKQCTWRVLPVKWGIGTDADRGRVPEPPAVSRLIH